MNDIATNTTIAPALGRATSGHLEQWIQDALIKGLEAAESATGLMFAETASENGEFVVTLHPSCERENVEAIAEREKASE